MKQTIRTILFLAGVTGLFLLSLFIKSPEKKVAPRETPASFSAPKSYTQKIFVPNEWAPLKEAVLGTPLMLTQSVCSDKTEGTDESEPSCAIRSIEESDFTFYEQLTAELKNLENVMTENGVRVSLHNPELLSDEELFYRRDMTRGVNFLCARKPVLVVGNTVIETTAAAPEFLSAKFSIRKIAHFLLLVDTGASLISMPEPSPYYPPNGVYLDASNILVDGRDVYVGAFGTQENQGAVWLQKALRKTHRVHLLQLKEKRSLDDVLAFIGPKTLIAEKDAFWYALPASLKNHRKIEISKQDNAFGLSDMMILSPTKIVLNEKNAFLKQLLEEEGFSVIGLPFEALAQTKTTLRCLYHPFKRAVE